MLETVLVEQLHKLNRIRFKGQEHEFSEANIQAAVQALKDVLYDGLVRTNEKIYDLLILGKSLQQTIDGDTKSFPLHYIDWNPETWLANNVFHVTEEFEVERTAQPRDAPARHRAVRQRHPACRHRVQAARHQGPHRPGHLARTSATSVTTRSPRLFLYSQLLLAISKNEAKYGTTGTRRQVLGGLEGGSGQDAGCRLVKRPLSTEQKDRLFGDRYAVRA